MAIEPVAELHGALRDAAQRRPRRAGRGGVRRVALAINDTVNLGIFAALELSQR